MVLFVNLILRRLMNTFVGIFFFWFVLRKIGFGVRWIKWGQRLVSCVLVSVLVNGSLGPKFGLEKGLWLGCHISSLRLTLWKNLFLYFWINFNLQDGFKAFQSKVCQKVSISFNLLIQFYFSSTPLTLLRGFRDLYLLTRLKINFPKSTIIGVGQDEDTIAHVVEVFGCRVGFFPISFLGSRLGAKSLSVVDGIMFWICSGLGLHCGSFVIYP